MNVHPTTISGFQNFIIRPYEGIESLQASLDLAEIVLDGVRFPAGNVSISSEQLPMKSGNIEVFLDVQGLEEQLTAAQIPLTHVRVACVVYGSVVAEAKILTDISVDELVSPLIARLEGCPYILRSPNGFDARVFLYLAEELQPNAWHPYLPGTWLAFREFRVSPQSALSRFSPSPLDDNMRHHYGLLPETLTYIRVGDGILETDSMDEDVDVLVDVSILRLLQENPTSPLARYIQLDLAVSTLWTIISKIAQITRPVAGAGLTGESSLDGSSVWAMCQALARSGGLSVEELLITARDDPGMARSIVEAQVKSLKTTSLALREVS